MRIAVLGNADALHTRRWATVLAGRGHAVRVFSLERPPAQAGRAAGAPDDAPDVTVIPSWPLPRAMRYPLARERMARALATFAPDLVEAHFVPNYGFLAALVGRHPLVVHAWGSDLLLSAERSTFHARRARYALSRADLVVADAHVLGQAALRHGARAETLLVMPWGADLARFPFAPFVALPHVISLRQLEPLYDLPTLLNALPAVRAAVPGLVVTLAGSGPLRNALEALARQLGVDDVVRFAGRLPHPELSALVSTAAVYVSTSRSDSTSIALLEAMATGAVPVVSDIPGNREWLVDGEGGRFFPVGDAAALARALIATLADAGFRRTARDLNRARVEVDGDWAKNVARIENRYHSLVGDAA